MNRQTQTEMRLGKRQCKPCGSLWKNQHRRNRRLIKTTCFVCGKPQPKDRSQVWR